MKYTAAIPALEQRWICGGTKMCIRDSLYSKGDVEIRDFFVKTQLDERDNKDSDATLELDVDIRGLHNAEAGEYYVEATLLDMENEEIGSMEFDPAVSYTHLDVYKRQTLLLVRPDHQCKAGHGTAQCG